LAAVKRDLCALEYASEGLRYDKDVIDCGLGIGK